MRGFVAVAIIAAAAANIAAPQQQAHPLLKARLNPPASSGTVTVVEVDQASIPAGTTWFHLRPTSRSAQMPTQIVPIGPDAASGQWVPRTAPKTGGRGPVGIQRFPFAGSSMFNAGNVAEIVPCNLSLAGGGRTVTMNSFIVEAWSDRNDLGDRSRVANKLLASSPSMTFTFDDQGFSHGLQFDQFSMRDGDPGQGTIYAHPTNDTLYGMAKLITWHGFLPIPGKSTPRGLPMFSLDVTLLASEYTTREFKQPQVNVSYSQPGVHFIGIYGAWSGQYGFNYPAPENGVRTYNSFPLDSELHTEFQPMAIVTPYENGTRPALPANFSGPVHVTKPIPGDWRMALHIDKLSVFNGGSVYLRMINGPAFPSGAQWAPQVIELEVPIGVRILSFGGVIAQFRSQLNTTDVSRVLGGGPVSPGYTRIRLNKPTQAEWMYLNVALPLTIEVDPALEGKHFPLAKTRAYTGAANQHRQDNWQKLAITVEKLTPVRALPKRLHTAFCWAGENQFVTDVDKGLRSVTTWQQLGFNVIPGVGASDATPPANPGTLLSPTNRTGPEWAGLKYGIETDPFNSAGFSSKYYGQYAIGSLQALKMPVGAADDPTVFNFSRVGLTAAEEATERAQWRNALEFYATNHGGYGGGGMMDLSYNGWFFRNDLAGVAKLINYSKPDFMTVDIEAFQELEPYVAVAYKSKNFEARRRPGESDSELSLRVARGWLGGIVSATKQAHTETKVYMYDVNARFDRGFQITDWPTAEKLGLAAEPAYYESQNGIDVLALEVRQQRLAIGTSAPLIPWLTFGETTDTGGPQLDNPGMAMFNRLLHIFANGATGFNMYVNFGLYDMALWLAFRDVIDLVTPYEDIVMDGAPAPSSAFSKLSGDALLSAMVDPAKGGRMLIASSTIPHGLPSSFTVVAEGATPAWMLCNVMTNHSVRVAVGGEASWDSRAEFGSLFLLGPKTPCHS